LELIADILLIAGTLGRVLLLRHPLAASQALFATSRAGVGGAIAALSDQVDQMTAAIGQAQTSAVASRAEPRDR
jgi:hypothetical protein